MHEIDTERGGHEVNPYQAPEGASDGYQPTADIDPEVKNAWRWKDAMIVRSRAKPKLPRRCAVSYLPRGIVMYPVSAISRLGLRLSFFCFLIPAVGWIAFILAIIPAVHRQDFRLPLRIPIAIGLLVIELAFFAILLVGNALSGYGVYVGDTLAFVGGTLLSLLAFGIFWSTDRLFLHTDILDRKHVAIRGLNEQFLASLPPLDEVPETWQKILGRDNSKNT
jgi:hypothetical protein